jgi:hypothetical protein
MLYWEQLKGTGVKELSEYGESTSEYELFSFLSDKIIAGYFTAFAPLKIFVEPILRDKRCHPVIMRCFDLVKKLYWGFFSGIDIKMHKRLWQELVVPDQLFPEAGNLKDTLQTSTLYVAMLDIHGYTQFCMESKNNPNRMLVLDWAINNDIRRISDQCQAVSQRERGDEIVVVAARASDALTVTLGIIDYFGKTDIVGDPGVNTKRTGKAAEAEMPLFKISGGITGGDKSPLIITEKGNLAGFLLNSGARLQIRANELSPRENRIMVAKQVQMSFLKENQIEKCALFKHNAVYFLDTGLVYFKGVRIPTCEAVFQNDERYKEQYSEELAKLFTSLRESLWEQRIYADLMALIAKAASVMKPFSAVLSQPINAMQTITNDSLKQLCRIGLKAYTDEDYGGAVQMLRNLIVIIDLIPNFDRLILDYLKGVTEKYELLLGCYHETMDREIDERASQIFQSSHLKAFQASKNAVVIYEKLKTMARNSPMITQKKALWFKLLQQNKEQMEFTLYSGKK